MKYTRKKSFNPYRKGWKSKVKFPRARKRGHFFPFVKIFLFLFIIFAIFYLGKKLFSNNKIETVFAEVQILSGRAEFSLYENDIWTRLLPGKNQRFFAGDSFRTPGNSKLSLKLLGGSEIFLNENSEIHLTQMDEKPSGKKTIEIKIAKGEAWIYVSENQYNSKKLKSNFLLKSDRAEYLLKSGIVNIYSSKSSGDTIQILRGETVSKIYLTDNQKEIKTINLGVGQKLTVNKSSLTRLENNENILEKISDSFERSEWHLTNLDKFFPEEVSQIRRSIEINAQKNLIEQQQEEALNTEIEFLTHKPNQIIPSNQEIVIISGTAPSWAQHISVNGYMLTRYMPGARKWVYNASRKMGTLVSGENIYHVQAIARDGRKSKIAELRLLYEAPLEVIVVPKNIDLSPAISSLDTFLPPEVLRPQIEKNSVYSTAEDRVTIAGVVDMKTNRVTVNDFRLKKFKIGSGEFSFIPTTKNKLLREGLNTYKIIAYGPDGKQSSAIFKVKYSPIKIN